MGLQFDKSRQCWDRARQVIPGGVNSPVRAFKNVSLSGEEAVPPFISSACGAEVTDIDGNIYLDYVGSWGPMILGHSAEPITQAISAALKNGTSFGAPTKAEVDFAEMLVELVPALEMVRLVNSGTEATMSALRLARGVTGRDYVIKCDGCYHGHSDSFLVSAGSGVATFGLPGTPGVPEAAAQLTLSVPFNDLSAVEQAVQNAGEDKVAALIVEPVPGNMGLVLPKPGYLQGLRQICDRFGIVLIFDEVMSGFRVSLGGAGERFEVAPDMVTLGKVIGGGLPVGAFGGRKELMSQLAPSGPVYQAGTLSGNPLGVAAGMAALSEIKRLDPYPALEELAKRWCSGMQQAADKHSVAFRASCIGSMLGFFFTDKVVENYADAKSADAKLFVNFFHEMLNRGIYLAPSPFEAGFLSTAHTNEQIDRTIAAADESFAAIA